MAKVAKLVRASLVTRVIVDENATEQDILELAIPKLSENLMDNPIESIDEIVDDLECPHIENKYVVTVTRVSNSTKEIFVIAANHSDAKDKAIELACNMEFSEQNSNYEIDNIIPLETNKSYFRLTETTKVHKGITLYQIELTKDCKWGKIGYKGGWVEKESNLSGNAWVSINAMVYGNAKVFGDAWVFGYAEVYGDAVVYGNAWVNDNAEVSGNAMVFGYAEVYGNAKVSGNAHIFGNAKVYGNARVFGNMSVGN
jgi:hypothetical protein